MYVRAARRFAIYGFVIDRLSLLKKLTKLFEIQELMQDPVVVPESGRSYEREYIQSWLKTSR